MDTYQNHQSRLPAKRDLSITYVLSFVIALLMMIVSLTGLLYGSIIYPTDELFRSFMPNDGVNLFLGIPILLGSMWLTQRGQLMGLLFWPGILFFVLYNYIAYIFAIPLNIIFLPCLILVMLSTYTVTHLVTSINATQVKKRLLGSIPERSCGTVLVTLGILFFVRVIGVIATALLNQTQIPTSEFAVLIADFLITPAWIIGGIMLWRRESLGYLIGIGALFQANILFVALLLFMIVQPILTSASFNLTDFIVVLAMGMICFIPFGLILRGTLLRRQTPA